MGVFDFVKEAGTSIGLGDKGEEEAAPETTSVSDAATKAATKAASEARAAEVAAKVQRADRAERAAARKERLAESAKSKALEAYVSKLGFEVDGLDVRYDDGVATVSGKVADAATREKVILAIGNTEGVGEVHDEIEVAAPAPAEAPAAPPAEESKMHVVVKGDTLSHLAKTYYGDATKYPVIFEANRPLLSDPDKIYVGQVLRIPSI